MECLLLSTMSIIFCRSCFFRSTSACVSQAHAWRKELRFVHQHPRHPCVPLRRNSSESVLLVSPIVQALADPDGHTIRRGRTGTRITKATCPPARFFLVRCRCMSHVNPSEASAMPKSFSNFVTPTKYVVSLQDLAGLNGSTAVDDFRRNVRNWLQTHHHSSKGKFEFQTHFRECPAGRIMSYMTVRVSWLKPIDGAQPTGSARGWQQHAG